MSEENKRIVRRLVEEGQGKGNLAVIDELVSETFVDHSPLPGLPPTRDGIRTLFGALRQGFPDMTVAIHEQIAEGDKVVTRKSLRGTHRGEFMGIAATSRPLDFPVIDIL